MNSRRPQRRGGWTRMPAPRIKQTIAAAPAGFLLCSGRSVSRLAGSEGQRDLPMVKPFEGASVNIGYAGCESGG